MSNPSLWSKGTVGSFHQKFQLEARRSFIGDIGDVSTLSSPQVSYGSNVCLTILWRNIVAVFFVGSSAFAMHGNFDEKVRSLAGLLWYSAVVFPAPVFFLVVLCRDWGRGKRFLFFFLQRIVPFCIFSVGRGIAYYYHLVQDLCGALPDILPGFGSGLSIVGFVLGFALVGRLSLSVSRWWEAKGAVADLFRDAKAHSVLLSALICEIAARAAPAGSEERRLLRRFHGSYHGMLEAMVLAMCSGLRGDDNFALRVASLTDQPSKELDLSIDQLELAHVRKRDLERAWHRLYQVATGTPKTTQVDLALLELQRMLEWFNDAPFARSIKPPTFAVVRNQLSGTFAAYHGALKVALSRVPSAYLLFSWVSALVYGCLILPVYLPYAFTSKVQPDFKTAEGEQIGCKVLINPLILSQFVLVLSCAELVIFGILALSDSLSNPLSIGTYDVSLEAEVVSFFSSMHASAAQVTEVLNKDGVNEIPWWQHENEEECNKFCPKPLGKSTAGENVEDGQDDNDDVGAGAAGDAAGYDGGDA